MTDIKEMSNEEFKAQIKWIILDTDLRTELFSRLEEGQKAIAELKTAKLDSARLIVQEEMYENAKCCGNCLHVLLTNDSEICKIDEPDFFEKNCCPQWKSDSLKRSEREIK